MNLQRSDFAILGSEDPNEVAARLARGDYQTELQLRCAILLLGETRFTSARQTIERYLEHDERWVRDNALSVLTHEMRIGDHVTTCIRIIEDGDDHHYGVHTNTAISGLGDILEGTRDETGLRTLLHVLRDPAQVVALRASAYRAIQAIEGIPIHERILSVGDDADLLSSIVDWNWIEDIEDRVKLR
jgi:hypothetical protein